MGIYANHIIKKPDTAGRISGYKEVSAARQQIVGQTEEDIFSVNGNIRLDDGKLFPVSDLFLHMTPEELGEYDMERIEEKFLYKRKKKEVQRVPISPHGEIIVLWFVPKSSLPLLPKYDESQKVKRFLKARFEKDTTEILFALPV